MAPSEMQEMPDEFWIEEHPGRVRVGTCTRRRPIGEGFYDRHRDGHPGLRTRMVAPRGRQGPRGLEALGLSAVEYNRQLVAIAVRPDAMAYDPLMVRRIRRLIPSEGQAARR